MTASSDPANAEIGRLLVLCNIVRTLPTSEQVALFTRNTLEQLSGVEEAAVEVFDRSRPSEPLDEGFPLSSGGRLFGAVRLRAGSAETVAVLTPHIQNALNLVALELERRETERSLILSNSELAELTNTLEQKVSERTESLEVANSSLQSLADRERKANRAKSEFLANLSHEFRTPLNAILGFSEFVLQEPSGPLGHVKYGEYLGDIHSSAAHLRAIVDDILDLSKVDAGAYELREQGHEAKALVDETMSMLRQEAARRGVALSPDIAAAVIVCDGRVVRQALLNVVANGVKFSPETSCLSIVGSVAPDGGYALTVTDRGRGMDTDAIGRAMRPFEQASAATRDEDRGTGLGLPIALAFMELHGGRLTMESAVGEGTRVTLWFPPGRVTPA